MSNEYNAERHVEGLRATIKRLESEKYALSEKLHNKCAAYHEALAMVKKLDNNNHELAKQVLDTGDAYDKLFVKYRNLFIYFICLGIMCLGSMVIIYYLLNYGH